MLRGTHKVGSIRGSPVLARGFTCDYSGVRQQVVVCGRV